MNEAVEQEKEGECERKAPEETSTPSPILQKYFVSLSIQSLYSHSRNSFHKQEQWGREKRILFTALIIKDHRTLRVQKQKTAAVCDVELGNGEKRVMRADVRSPLCLRSYWTVCKTRKAMRSL